MASASIQLRMLSVGFFFPSPAYGVYYIVENLLDIVGIVAQKDLILFQRPDA
jgi:hypothetical protein